MTGKPLIPKPVLRQRLFSIPKQIETPEKTKKTEDLEGLKSLQVFYYYEFGLSYSFTPKENEEAGSELEINK
jgi:hypothetical protein